MQSLLNPSSVPAKKRFIFKDTIWLGGKHDGYPLSSLREYMKIRSRIDATTPRERAAEPVFAGGPAEIQVSAD